MQLIRNISIFGFFVAIPAVLVFAQELTPEIKQKVIEEYFRTRTLWDVLSTHYNNVIYVFIALVLATIWLVRKYIKHASKAETRLLNALSKDALMIFDARGDLKQLNRAARLLLGLDEFVSMQFDYKYYFKMAPSPEIQDTFEEMLRTHHQVEREIIFNQGKLLRTLVCKGQPVYQESRKLEGYVFLIQDITQAIENDRRINWTGVAQHVAHKAKTPLSTITLTAQHLDLLVQDLKLDKQPQISKYLDRIVAESKKLNGIVHSLTRLAHREQYNCQPYDINALLENIVSEYRAKASSNIEIITNLNRTIPRALVDINHFPEAIQNLMDNAIRAIGTQEGRITVLTSRGEWIDRRGAYVEITISDTGVGMPDDVKKKIFRPFSSFSQGGTGLGLVIVQKIISEHQGEITFNSVLDVGTEFHIRIPSAPVDER